MLIAFDLDGTLVDSRHDLADSANEMLERFGASPLSVDRITSIIGNGARQLVERALAAAGLPASAPRALEQFLEIYDRRLLDRTRPYDGILEVLRRASGHAPLAVLTNKPEAPTRRLLEAFDMAGLFRWVVGGDSGFPRKPDPAGLQHLIAASGSTPMTTLMVGDSQVDIETARRARCGICVVLYGFGEAHGPISWQGDERRAATASEIGGVIDEFIASGGARGGRSHPLGRNQT